METQIEVQMSLNRLNIVEQEILRLEQEIDNQKVIEADCDAITERLNNRLFSQNSNDDYRQRMRQLNECADRKIVALEKDLKLGRQLRQLREERGQLMSRIKSFSAASHCQPTLQSAISNLYQET